MFPLPLWCHVIHTEDLSQTGWEWGEHGKKCGFLCSDICLPDFLDHQIVFFHVLSWCWVPFIFLLIYIFMYLFIAFEGHTWAFWSSQARGGIRATAASLHHSHTNMGPETYLWSTPQLKAMPALNPLSEARDWALVLMDTSRVHYHWVMTGSAILSLPKILSRYH